jgi:hypothetical protein
MAGEPALLRFIRIARAAAFASFFVAACGGRSPLLLPLAEEDHGDAAGFEGGVDGSSSGGDATSADAEGGLLDDGATDANDADVVEEDGGLPTCMPRSCSQLGYLCGENGDGCGGILMCGVCPVPQICGVAGYSQCGGGFGLGPDGGPLCTPKTCTDLGFDCGPAGDGCGGIVQCGTCQAPLQCGAAGSPNRCGSTCTGLCAQQVACEAGTTSVSGTVVTGTLPQFGSPDPVYDALVYVPNGKIIPFSAGVSCNQCGADVSGDPLVATKTAPDGTFTLQNVPVGNDIPLVIQLGRWRRQVTIPSVAACTDTPLPTSLTRLPRNQAEGDIPLTAIATGSADALECVLMKMGVDQSEFTLPSGTGRVQVYRSNGVDVGPGTPPAESLWGDPTALARYDQVLFSCEGVQIDKDPTDQQNVIDYTNAGGRLFATHYSYTWLYNDPPFEGTANWSVNAGAGTTQAGIIDTSTQKGQDFASWLGNVGALSGPAQIDLRNTRFDVLSVNAPTEQLIYAQNPAQTLHFDFTTPIGSPPAQQCGRVVFSDFHVTDVNIGGQTTFPTECPPGPLSSQEKALEFMLFDLGACVPTAQTCVPRTCGDLGLGCGPAGDGCGGQIDCGTCAPPTTCGGGGVYGQCGYPDAGTCTPKTCAELGFDCGVNGDGCGGVQDCGTCIPPQICGGGGAPSVCGP